MTGDLAETTDFGDWLSVEIGRATAQAQSGAGVLTEAVLERLRRLRVAREVLLEFLTLQQAMLEAATRRRSRG